MKKKLIKQGIDPTTHKPLSHDDRMINSEIAVNDNKNCTEQEEGNLVQCGLRNVSNLSSHHGPTFLVSTDSSNYFDGEGSREVELGNKQITAFDSLSNYYFDGFQNADTIVEPTGYKYNGSNDILSQYDEDIIVRPNFNSQNYVTAVNSNFGFDSMPSLANSSGGTDFSDNNSASKMSSNSSSLFMNNNNNNNEVKESSSNNSSNNMSNYLGFNQMNNNNNIGNFSTWDSHENKLDVYSNFFQFHHELNGIKSEENMKTMTSTTSSWQEGQFHLQNSADFMSCYPLTTSLSEDLTGANFDVFHPT